MNIEISEKQLEDLIMSADAKTLRSIGLNERLGLMIRQFDLGNYGIADIVSIVIDSRREILVTIFELKKCQLDLNTIVQCARYIKGAKEYIDTHYNTNRTVVRFKMVLIGLQVAHDLKFICDCFDNLSVYQYNYSIKGVKFIPQEYSFVKKIFPPKTKEIGNYVKSRVEEINNYEW